MGDLRELAREALSRAAVESSPAGAVARVVVDVEVLGRLEMVSVAIVDGELRCVSSDGKSDSPHVRAALEWIAGVTVGGARVAVNASMVPAVVREAAPANAAHKAFEEVVTSVLRTGTRDAAGSPTVEDALARLEAALPKPLPLAVSRWFGRLSRALERRDDGTVARLLEGAIQVADDLGDEAPTVEAERRRALWTGARSDRRDVAVRLTDRSLLELARETVPGRMHSVTRRYLMCLQTGEIFSEDGPRADVPLSVGPCPRIVNVGLAELESGRAPRSVRILQYTVAHEVTPSDWIKVQRFGTTRFERLAQDYKRGVRESPSLSEPFVVVTPAKVELDGGVPLLIDPDGFVLPLDADDGTGPSRVLEPIVGGHDVAWVAGRLVDSGGRLRLIPLSAGVLIGSDLRFRRVA